MANEPQQLAGQSIDARQLSGTPTLSADVCIIGAGPAGISLAQELAGSNLRVLLLESGGYEYDQATQDLCRGELAGDRKVDPYVVRARQFGGTSNKFTINIGGGVIGLRYAPFDPIDFECRPEVADSGWPFPRTELDSYYERAQSFCQLGPLRYDAGFWSKDARQEIGIPGEFETTMFQFGPASVFKPRPEELVRRNPRLTILLHANVLQLRTSADGARVVDAEVATLAGTRFTASAKQFVLATGAIENARLLLLSNATQAAGIGNDHDQVGRYLIDHPLNYDSYIVPSGPDVFERLTFFDMVARNGVSQMGKFTATENAIRQRRLLNMSSQLFPREWTQATAAVTSFRNLIGRPNRFPLPPRPSQRLAAMMLGPATIARHISRVRHSPGAFAYLGLGGWSAVANKPRMFSVIDVVQQVEQYPRRENRVTLSTQRDALNQPLVRFDYSWSAADQRLFAETNAFYAQMIEKTGIGKYCFDPEAPPTQPSAHHQMGTTRMHADPRHGVTDANCRVHGVSNLYVSGASLFPVGGYANPTLTIIAMALRLADRLKRETPA
jgi:choline dehydrogenase-like flavoprotein